MKNTMKQSLISPNAFVMGILCCTMWSSNTNTVTSFTITNQISSTSTSTRTRTHTSVLLQMSDRGWDNGNYLNALGSGQQSIDEANASYQQESEARAMHQEKKFQQAIMTKDERLGEFLNEEEDEELGNELIQRNTMIANNPIPVPKMDNEIEEENPMGGNRFRKMMEQAQQVQSMQPPMNTMDQYQNPQPVQPQMQQPQMQVPPPPPPQPQQPMQGQGTIPQMTPQDYYQALQAWQQAMVAFQQFSAANPQAAAQMTPPPPPPPPPVFTPEGTAAPAVPVASAVPAASAASAATVPVPPQPQQPPTSDSSLTNEDNNNSNVNSLNQYLPKRAGGNNDAYEVNNSADVYFAQLKRDSTIRTEARKRGDLQTANAPFQEKGVLALKNYLSDELIEQRRARLKQNGGEFETSRDEMILPQHFEDGEDDLDKAYTGVSYKEKLMQAKMRKNGGSE